MSDLTNLHRAIIRHLDEIRKLLPPGMRLSLIARDPCADNGDVMVNDDMHQLGMLLKVLARFHLEGRAAGDSVIPNGPAGAAPVGNSKVERK